MGDEKPEDDCILTMQNVRNGIINVLGLFASFDDQRKYKRNVPICYVPYELISTWEDLACPLSFNPAMFISPVFSDDERIAIEEFQGEWGTASDALPDNFPSFDEVLNSPYWARLRDAAVKALKAFKQ